MFEACGTYEREMSCIQCFDGETWQNFDNLEDEEVDWKVMLDPKGMVRKCVGWIGLYQDKEMWRAAVNTVMNIRDP